MKPTVSLGALALSLASSALFTSAQFLNNQQYAVLPSCADNCAALTGPQSSCGSGDWSCFCSAVWSQISSAPSQVCSTSCTAAADVATTYQWYTQNCGSDNGASEHPAGASGSGGNGNSNNGGSGGSGTSSSAPSSSSGATSSGSGSGSSDTGNQSWFDGHWRWVVMIIVLFFGLLGLALLGLWLKKRHYRRRDQITTGFNSGITERAPPMSSHPNMTQHVNDSSMLSHTHAADSATGRDSPARTREAFMPYGYGYTRSESRLGSNPEIGRAASPLARGQTPVDTIERGAPVEEGAAPSAKKSRRVLVRERSGADSAHDVAR